MKNLLCLLILAFNLSSAQILFETTDSVDEFGDKVGEVQRNISTGTFSNSATTDSPLRVHTILEVTPDYTLEQYKEFLTKSYEKLNFSEKEIKSYLRYADRTLKTTKNINGTIRFDLYEYEDNKPITNEIKTGTISIKTSEGIKIKAYLGETSFINSSVTITGYKELTKGALGVRSLIKYKLYDWAQSDVYNEIINANGQIQVVIVFGNATYKFTLEP